MSGKKLTEKKRTERGRRMGKWEKERGKTLPNCPDLLRVERYGSCSLLFPPCF
jgi:hypothetical protein